MSRVYYNKLIRDGIPGKIKGNGESCEVRVCADADEFQQELLKKIQEEAGALAMTRTKAEYLSELADLLVVLDTVHQVLGFTQQDIDRAKESNIKAKGGFDKKYYLRWSSDSAYTSNESAQGVKHT